ncbi:MAG: metal-dependent phosphohydrolase [Candidatus Woesearchaeota archaeon]
MYHSKEILELLKKEVENEKLAAMIEDAYSKYKSYYEVSNKIVMEIYKYNDHGITHVMLTALRALRALKILKKFQYQTTLEKLGKSFEFSKFVVIFGSIFHDIGNAIHRKNHYLFSVFMADSLIDDYCKDFTDNFEDYLLLKSLTLNAIYTHDENVECTTIEGSCVTLADGCDMEEGRSRLAYHKDKTDIHSISALSIEKVDLEENTKELPLKVKIRMKHLAGIFQVDEVLGKKIKNSLLTGLVKVEIYYNDQILEKVF